MPECRFYATFDFCNMGDECLYLHVEKKAKRRECEDFRRGFCRNGEYTRKLEGRLRKGDREIG